MNDILLNLLVLAGFLLAGGFIFWFVQKKQSEKKSKISQMAASEGWSVEMIREPLAWGTRLKTDKWTFEALSRSSGRESGPGSSNIAMSTRWWADYPGSTILIGRKNTQDNLGELGDVLIRKMLRMALGEQANGLVEVRAGSEAFRRNFMVWAQEPAEVERLLDPILESSLTFWKNEALLIKRTSRGWTIELRGKHLEDIHEICKFIHLGESLIAME